MVVDDNPVESTRLTDENFELNLARHTVPRGGQNIARTTREVALLNLRVRRRECPASRTSIGEHLGNTNDEPSSNVIGVYNSMLRRELNLGLPKPLI